MVQPKHIAKSGCRKDDTQLRSCKNFIEYVDARVIICLEAEGLGLSMAISSFDMRSKEVGRVALLQWEKHTFHSQGSLASENTSIHFTGSVSRFQLMSEMKAALTIL